MDLNTKLRKILYGGNLIQSTLTYDELNYILNKEKHKIKEH